MRSFGLIRLGFLGFAAICGMGIFTGLIHDSPFSLTQSHTQLNMTLVCAFCVWVQDIRSLRWTVGAFAILVIGMLRVIFSFNALSLTALQIVGVAAAFVLLRYFGPRLAPKPVVTRATATQAKQPPQRDPLQPPPPDTSFAHLIKRARYTFADLVGMAETKKRLLAAGQEILSRDGTRRNGVLLFGEPGNGKTMFAEALAGELNVPFFCITYGDIASKWVNDTPEKVQSAFNQVRRIGRCVMFIDEFDSFVKPREDNGHSMDRDLANVMLTNINDLHGTQIVLIAATNFIDNLDGAAIRDGRFDFRIEVPAPDFEARQAILRKSIGEALGYAALDGYLLSSLAERWAGFSASRLASLGGALAEMRRDGQLGAAKITFDHGMQAMRLLQGRKGKLPENVKTIDQIIMPAHSRDVLHDLAFRMQRVHLLEKNGGSLPSGLIFYGPPGTGKTQAAMALAQASGYGFLRTTGAAIMGHPTSWDTLVREAKDIRPVIVFIDEADDILADRRYSNVASLTNKILTTLDGADGRVRDVIYIAATNHYDRLDSAAIRGGRFEEKVQFDVPEQQDMKRYIKQRLAQASKGQYVFTPGVTAECMAALSGRSIADADALISRAMNFAAVRLMQSEIAELRADDIAAAARAIFVD